MAIKYLSKIFKYKMTTQVRIWYDFYYPGHYVLFCETLSSQIMLVYIEKTVMLGVG